MSKKSKFLAALLISLVIISGCTHSQTTAGSKATPESAPRDFTIIVLPDTQHYSESFPHVFTNQTEWIVQNKEKLNIVFVSHEGDLVEEPDVTEQWKRALKSMSVLDGVVPYGVLPGNHDIPTENYNKYFPADKYKNKPWFAGHYPPDKNDNNYQLFSASSLDFVILHLQFEPDRAALQWADNVLKKHSDRFAIITTHGYLGERGRRSVHMWEDTTPIWRLAENNPNVHFILCGHVHNEYTRINYANGHKVFQLLADYQELPSGGNGYLRIMTFSPENNEVYIKTYSPYLDKYMTDSKMPRASEFTIPFEMTRTAVKK